MGGLAGAGGLPAGRAGWSARSTGCSWCCTGLPSFLVTLATFLVLQGGTLVVARVGGRPSLVDQVGGGPDWARPQAVFGVGAAGRRRPVPGVAAVVAGRRRPCRPAGCSPDPVRQRRLALGGCTAGGPRARRPGRPDHGARCSWSPRPRPGCSARWPWSGSGVPVTRRSATRSSTSSSRSSGAACSAAGTARRSVQRPAPCSTASSGPGIGSPGGTRAGSRSCLGVLLLVALLANGVVRRRLLAVPRS